MPTRTPEFRPFLAQHWQEVRGANQARNPTLVLVHCRTAASHASTLLLCDCDIPPVWHWSQTIPSIKCNSAKPELSPDQICERT